MTDGWMGALIIPDWFLDQTRRMTLRSLDLKDSQYAASLTYGAVQHMEKNIYSILIPVSQSNDKSAMTHQLCLQGFLRINTDFPGLK